MEHGLLSQIIDRIRSVRIAVIGDFCLDAYFFIDRSMSEISIETGLPTHPVKIQRYSLGGAGNLANNIASLGVKKVTAFGVVGDDLFGKEMLNIMKNSSIDISGMFVQEKNWSTHVYCKPYINEEEQSRIDFGNFNILEEKTADQLMDALLGDLQECDVIVINQQVHSGIHTDYLGEKLADLVSRYPDKTMISDIRNKNRLISGTFLKINEREAVTLCGMETVPGSAVLFENASIAAEMLFKKTGKPVFITRGGKGSLAIDSSGIINVPGLMHYGQIDPVGAGDSYLAGTAVSLAAGFSVGISAQIGSFAAGVTVRKLFQTGTAAPAEILDIARDPDYIYEPELAENPGKALYFDGSEIEIINRWTEDLTIGHAIFDHDGTISTLRQGWEPLMAGMMIKAVLGNKYGSIDKATHDKINSSVNELIDNTTGLQTLAQMAALVKLVGDHGLVPKEEILDMHGYKKIYNDELIRMVRQREEKIKRGELTVDDFTIKSVVPFIEKLYNAGIKLYLASGTDQEDVEHEARLLGYYRFFEGGIFGAVGDIKKEAKKMVLETILGKIGDTNCGQIIAFGDGPVEIRETRKKGGRTVGIASDEIRRFGLNEKKRARLIRAGADIIIPDFTQTGHLFRLLNL